MQLVLRTEDERDVHCVFIEHPDSRGERAPDAEAPPPLSTPVVLLLHANAMVGLDMADYAQWYRRQVIEKVEAV